MLAEWKTIALLTPEALLIAAASAMFVAGAFTRNRAWWTIAAIVSYIGAAVLLASQSWPMQEFSVATGPVLSDPMSVGIGLLRAAVL